jgi:hypothetical protein
VVGATVGWQYRVHDFSSQVWHNLQNLSQHILFKAFPLPVAGFVLKSDFRAGIDFY